MHSLHLGGGTGFNAYGGNNHGNGNFTPRRHVGVGNFSSYAKSFEHTSYEDYVGYGRVNNKYDYYEHSSYECYEGYHHSFGREFYFNFSKVNEIPQAQEVVEESVVLHVKEEISIVEHCDFMRDKNIEKESIEIKEKERVEDKERLVQRLCIFDSISIFSKESAHLECSKEKEMNSYVCIILKIQVRMKFFGNEQKLSSVITSLNTLFENTVGFQFYHLHFKELLLKDFENRMGAKLELFKLNPLAFEKSNLRKEAFEQVCKDFVVGHLYYRRSFKEWFLKLFLSFDSIPKNSCALILKQEF
ncbi:hypothetical protein M9H77_18487 [Catharanthus roseus]|uniref:Uncharacterized protein n=1 Tax=Catharanthus roseus TaxID=4058 RepID=A0ACC0B7N6_CATRO|nr:hypothetical protein M9H77_18487 [Catharanthus roseus]